MGPAKRDEIQEEEEEEKDEEMDEVADEDEDEDEDDEDEDEDEVADAVVVKQEPSQTVKKVVKAVQEPRRADPGRGKSVRHMKNLRMRKPAEDRISLSSIRRLAARSGIARMTGPFLREARPMLKEFVTSTDRKAALIAHHSWRKTVTARDVEYALRLSGNGMYGADA